MNKNYNKYYNKIIQVQFVKGTNSILAYIKIKVISQYQKIKINKIFNRCKMKYQAKTKKQSVHKVIINKN